MRRLALMLVAIAACTAATPDTLPGESITVPPSTAASPSPHPIANFVRTCDTAVFGDLGPGWIQTSVVVGPIVFVSLRGYASLPRSEFHTPDGKGRAVKVLVVVHGRRPVTLRVAAPFRARASLLYDPERFLDRNVAPIGLGDPAVRFEPCGGGRQQTQFNGGFLVEGPACVPIEVRTADGTVRRTTLPFGAGDCR
jgi:hypothetical protein